ncbi:hypothetical protein Pfo_009684 [Paulownia fortunei]|nr:hypothetical protein Pfo_009684 [Paulownia fortunei]
MERDKRKREDDGGASAKRGKEREDDDGAKGVVVPGDEEVEEFFSILKRIQVAVKYFQERNGGRCADRHLMATPWHPSFEREDFEGVKKEAESSGENQKAGLDLNSDPASDVLDNSA